MASNTVFTIIIAILAIALVGVVIYMIILLINPKKLKESKVIGINLMSHYANGRALGVEEDIDNGAGGRYILKFKPTDIHPKNINVAKEEELVVGKNKLLSFPKGTWSKEKDINIYLPPQPSDLPEAVAQTPFGQAMSMLILKKNYEEMIQQLYEKDAEKARALLEDMSMGEISKEWLERAKGFFIDDIKNYIKEGKRPATTPSFPAQPSIGGPR